MVFLRDVLVTNLLVKAMVAMVWWGVWTLQTWILQQLHRGPDDGEDEAEKKIFWHSLIIGYSLSIVIGALNPMLQRLQDAARWHIRIAKADMHSLSALQHTPGPWVLHLSSSLLSFLASVAVWLGLWSLAEHYLASHWLPWLALYLLSGWLVLQGLGVSNTTGCDGVVQDWQEVQRTPEEEGEMTPLLTV